MTGPDPKALLARAGSTVGGMSPAQRVTAVLAALAVAIGGFFFYQWVSTPSYAPLFTGLSGSDAAAVTAKLAESGTPYQLADGGQTVLVPQKDVYQQRINLSGEGIPAGDDSSQGYSLLDDQSMTSSDFQQKVTYQRALEGELAKTIGAIEGVRSTVVHLAVPQDDVFTADETKPTASVLVKTAPGVSLSSSAVDSIVNLVSGSVPKLQAADVTVADASGQVLSAGGDGSGAAGGSDARRTQETAVSESTAASVQSMLDKVLGPGRSVVRVDATLDFDDTTTDRQEYLPSKPSTTLTSQSSTETYEGTGGTAGGVMGSTNAPTTTSGDGSYSKEEKSQTNAVGTLKQRTVQAPGTVERLSIAVLLDARAAGVTSPDEVSRLVSAAAGVDLKRGDVVEVSQIAFDQTSAAAAEKELEAAAEAEEQARLVDIGKTVGLGVLVLLALLVGLRMTRRREDPQAPELLEYYPVQDGPSPATQVLEMAEARAALPARELPEPFVPAGREAVETLARDNPDDVARLLRGWISEGAK